MRRTDARRARPASMTEKYAGAAATYEFLKDRCKIK
jgi:hypothetical protein